MIFLKSLDNNEIGHFDAVAKTHSFCNLKWKKTNTNRQLKKILQLTFHLNKNISFADVF